MAYTPQTTVHASCVLVGRSAVLIRGPSGSGKSRLAAELIDACAATRGARLVADDRVHLFAANGRLLARTPEPIKGRMEMRGLGVRDVEHEPLALVSLVVDLAASDAARMPADNARTADVSGVKLSRLPVAANEAALLAVLAAINELTQR